MGEPGAARRAGAGPRANISPRGDVLAASERLSDDARYQRARDVRFRVVGDEGVVVRQEAAEVIAVNDVGARVLSLLDGERRLGEVAQLLSEEYEAEYVALRADVDRFVMELLGAGVLREVARP